MFSKCLAVCGILCVLIAVGCNDQSATSETKSEADTFEQALFDVETLKDKIRDSFAEGDIDAAHDPLHEIGNRLEDVSRLAADTTLSGDDVKSVETCVNELFAAFGEIDKTFHGEEGATYEEEAETIDNAMERLSELEAGIK